MLTLLLINKALPSETFLSLAFVMGTGLDRKEVVKITGKLAVENV